MALRPEMPSVFSTSISAGRPWQSQPKRRSTRWPFMVWKRGIRSFTYPVKRCPKCGSPLAKGGPS